jgi:hypothetical protein
MYSSGLTHCPRPKHADPDRSAEWEKLKQLLYVSRYSYFKRSSRFNSYSSHSKVSTTNKRYLIIIDEKYKTGRMSGYSTDVRLLYLKFNKVDRRSSFSFIIFENYKPLQVA